MGIDRIGKGGGASAIPDASAPQRIEPAERFEVDEARPTSGSDGDEPIARLAAGKISVDEYLELRIDQATVHLQGRVDDEQMTFIRSTLRAELQSDPALAELVRRAVATAGKNALSQ